MPVHQPYSTAVKLLSSPRASASALLLVTGLSSTACILLLLSQHTSPLSQTDSLFLVLFLQWQTFGLTIAKFGMDQVAFAHVSNAPLTRLALQPIIIQRCLPLATVYSVASSNWLGVFSSTILFSVILIDCYSLLLLSQCNARGRYLSSAISQLLNYPLFFALVGILTCVTEPSIEMVLGCFLASSIARAIYLQLLDNTSSYNTVLPRMPAGLVAMQLLNYWIFKGDQLILMNNWSWATDQPDTRDYLLNTKFTEIVAAVSNIISVVLLPRFYLSPDLPWPQKARRLSGLFLGGAAILIPTKIIYLWIMSATPLGICGVAFSITAAAVFPSNLLAYSFLRSHRLSGLIFMLAMAAAIGGALTAIGAILRLQWLHAIAIGAAAQAAVLCILPMFISWGRSQHLAKPEAAGHKPLGTYQLDKAA